MIRTHEAGTLRAAHAGEHVVLAGWVARRRDHGGVVFIDLRDASGVVQVVWRGEEAVAHELRAEFCVLVTGTVRTARPGTRTRSCPPAQIEVVADEVEVLSEADPLPFPVEGSAEVSEDIRLKYRYLDIRRDDTARALRVRSQAAYLLSDVMREHRFVNVETPYLTRSTPEGARDFLVPVRLRPGNWYALPQSPQLFKQLLMVGGLERYYQLARCFRDEDFRKDRQPEFTQIDIEMSFVTRRRRHRRRRGHRGAAVVRAGRLPGAHAAAQDDLRRGDGAVRLGQARPAVRLRAHRPDRVLRRDGVPGVPGAVRGRRGDAGRRRAVPARARRLAGVGPVPRRPRARLRADRRGRRGRRAGGQEPVRGRAVRAGRRDRRRAGRLRVLRGRAAARGRAELLGAARLEIGQRCGLIDESAWSFLWVVDAPMFEEDGDGGWTSVHHPFTAPLPEWADKFTAEPGGALADAYDIVCNGYEIGGGSIRIHQSAMQQAVFDVIGLSPEEARSQFGFLLDAFKYGPPPHGGIAFGWDRVMHAAGRGAHHPRRDRLPQGRLRPRPADRRAHPHHPRPAPRGRHRRPAHPTPAARPSLCRRSRLPIHLNHSTYLSLPSASTSRPSSPSSFEGGPPRSSFMIVASSGAISILVVNSGMGWRMLDSLSGSVM